MSVARYKSNTQEVDVVHFTVGNKNAVVKFMEEAKTLSWIRCNLEDEYDILCLDKNGISHQLFENCYVLYNGEELSVMSPTDFEEQYTLIEEASPEIITPTIVENPNNTPTDYRLDITDVHGTITTPNLIGMYDDSIIQATITTLQLEVNELKTQVETMKQQIEDLTNP